jgi:hypothetical protein
MPKASSRTSACRPSNAAEPAADHSEFSGGAQPSPTLKELSDVRQVLVKFLESEFDSNAKIIDNLRGMVIPSKFSPKDLLKSKDPKDFQSVYFLLPELQVRDVDIFAGPRRGEDEIVLLQDPSIFRACFVLHYMATAE